MNQDNLFRSKKYFQFIMNFYAIESLIEKNSNND